MLDGKLDDWSYRKGFADELQKVFETDESINTTKIQFFGKLMFVVGLFDEYVVHALHQLDFDTSWRNSTGRREKNEQNMEVYDSFFNEMVIELQKGWKELMQGNDWSNDLQEIYYIVKMGAPAAVSLIENNFWTNKFKPGVPLNILWLWQFFYLVLNKNITKDIEEKQKKWYDQDQSDLLPFESRGLKIECVIYPGKHGCASDWYEGLNQREGSKKAHQVSYYRIEEWYEYYGESEEEVQESEEEVEESEEEVEESQGWNKKIDRWYTENNEFIKLIQNAWNEANEFTNKVLRDHRRIKEGVEYYSEKKNQENLINEHNKVLQFMNSKWKSNLAKAAFVCLMENAQADATDYDHKKIQEVPKDNKLFETIEGHGLKRYVTHEADIDPPKLETKDLQRICKLRYSFTQP
jgi:hypothetical protein